MGYIDDSIIGFDYNFDGKINMLDDIMFFGDMENEDSEKMDDENDIVDDEYFDEDSL